MSFDVKPVTGADVVPLESVKVRPDQDKFVAPNPITIAQARFEGEGAYDFVLWDGETRVGLIAVIDMGVYPDRDPEDDPEAIYVWRLLVGAEFQGKGYGRKAMAWAEDWAQTRGRSKIQIQAVEENVATIAIYEHLGYRRTGVVVGKEIQLEKAL